MILPGLLLMGVLTLASPEALASPELDPIDQAVVETQNDPEARAALEQECLEKIFAEDTPFVELYRSFRILAVVATEESIDPLSTLLDDEDRGHLARNVLEKMPQEEVDWVLLDALARTTGDARLGIITTLSFRRTPEAVEPLAALLSHDDVQTARAAALALGNIGTIEALEAINTFYTTTPREELEQDLAKGALAAARNLVNDGQVAPAVAAYEQLMEEEWPDFVRSGAFTGLLEALPEEAPDIVYDAIHGDDELFSVVAIAAVSTLEGERLTERLAEDLENLPAELQARLLDAFGERRDPAALPVVHDSLESDEADVRMAAMKAASVLGDTSSIEPLGKILAESDDRQERLAAIESLRRITDPDMNDALIAYMNEVDSDVRPDIMEVLVQRGAVEAIDAIVAQVENEEMRPAVFRALGELVTGEQLPLMLELLTELESDSGRNDAINAVVALCNRIAEASAQNVSIEKAVYGVLPDGPQEDVTDTIAHQVVNQGRDTIYADNDLGGDPAPGEPKQLRVDYTVDGVPGSRTIDEGESMSIAIGMSTPALVEQIADSLEEAPSTEASVSLLRVLSRLGGRTAYDVVASYVNHENEEIHDGAVRALSSWPDVLAVDALVNIFKETEDTTHRMLALRGAVRLLRMEGHSTEETLAFYKDLSENASTRDERMLIISGLSNVADPAALRLVEPYLDDESVEAEAEIAFRSIAEALEMDADQLLEERAANKDSADAEGFVSLFDGESLDGWHGDPDLWRVEDGHIIGETTEDNPVEHNTFLVSDGEYSDFELKFSYRIESDTANSGVQVRSEEFETNRVRGYQADIATEDWITGICYEEGGRGVIARRGQRVHLTADGESEVEQFADEDDLAEHINTEDWNDYHIQAEGNTLVARINGQVMHEVIDDAPEARDNGVIAFQLHVGDPMKLNFKDIRIKKLS